MCGIAGILSLNPEKVHQSRIQLMTDALRHRGPQGEGFFIGGNGKVGFGHRRLCIIDLSGAGHQPMHYGDRYTITYNGEIYNYIEIRNTLLKKGYSFASQCDTEVVLAAYACWGSDCLRYFDGMFAFAIWDEQNNTLFCARDRFGEKPFYYALYDDQLVFASEMKALWAAGVQKQPDHSMLLAYLSNGITSHPWQPSATFYSHISKLPAAHAMWVHCDGAGIRLSVQPYWDIDKISQQPLSVDEAQAKVHSLFIQSVNNRLRSDVLVGTSLSGGLDSAAVIAAITKSGQQPIQSFSAVFPGFDKDESALISQVSAHFGIKSYTIAPGAKEVAEDFERVCYHQEEPFQSLSVSAQYQVYQLAARQGVTVLLDGQGADETFAGYSRYQVWYWQQLLASGRWKAAARQRSLAPPSARQQWGLKNYLAVFLPGLAAQRLKNKAFNILQQQPFIHRDFKEAYTPLSIFEKPVVENLNDILYFNTLQGGLEDLLRYADRNSMAHSREVRLPFLQHNLVETAFSLPAEYKIHDGYGKWILRKAFSTLLPQAVAWQKEKTGFEPPQQQWMQNAHLLERLNNGRNKLVTMGVLHPSVLTKKIEQRPAHAANNFDWWCLCAAQFV